MNVTGPQDARLSLETWNAPDMRRALASRDISSVYRLLRRVGMSQRHIAALTGQSQSEVSEILKGRQVMAYEVLVRISEGLGIPRGYMGLAYDPSTATSIVGPPDVAAPTLLEEEESVKRRKLLAHGTAMVFGTTLVGADHSQGLPALAQTPIPSRIGVMDVRQVEATTRALRALDYEYGGGTVRDAVVAQLSWAQRLLGCSSTEEVSKQLFRALGDLQNLAGWTSFDVGLLDSSRRHFASAMEFANRSGDSSLMSNIMYRVGRVYIHHEDPNEALKWFQLGQIAAQNAGSEQAVAVLCANEARVYAMLNDEVQAQKLLDRARSELARVDPGQEPSWAQFFDRNEMNGVASSVYSELALSQPRHAAAAISLGRDATAGYDVHRMARSRALTLWTLTTSYLRQGDMTSALQTGRVALTAASAVKSARFAERLKPMQVEMAQWAAKTNHPDARELCQLFRAQPTLLS